MDPKKGCILLAELGLTGDMTFSRSVIYLAEHNGDGSVGFVLNKPSKIRLSHFMKGVKIDFPIYKGGPVDTDNLYFLHKVPKILPGSYHIDKDLYWGGDFDCLENALKDGTLDHSAIKFFLGYSGWMPQQLAQEIKSHSWIVLPNDYDVLSLNSTSDWKDKIKAQGDDYLIWANSPEHPGYN